MKSIGSLMVVLGILAIVLQFMDRVPRLLFWIYEWGEGVAWAIKIGFIVVGAVLYILGSKNSSGSQPAEPPTQ